MLYGQGISMYKRTLDESGKIVRHWEPVDEPMRWLEEWEMNGIEMSASDFAMANIKNHYTFRDFFVKYRMSRGASIGRFPIAGIESMENKDCRLATLRADVATSLIPYKDLRYVAVGNWNYGAASFNVYPRFDIKEVSVYRYAAIGHHREKSVGEYYGSNETFEGTKPYIKAANENPEYINSFLRNALAAKVHIIIPNAWVESKRRQITSLCNENKKRKSEKLELFKMGDVELGTEYSESTLMKVINTGSPITSPVKATKAKPMHLFRSRQAITKRNAGASKLSTSSTRNISRRSSSMTSAPMKSSFPPWGSTPPYRPFPRTVLYPRAALTSITTTSCTFLALLQTTKNAPPRSTMSLCSISRTCTPRATVSASIAKYPPVRRKYL